MHRRFLLAPAVLAVAVGWVAFADPTGGGGSLIPELGEDPAPNLADLSDAKKAPAAVQALVAQGDGSVEPLTRVAISADYPLSARGWAISGLQHLGGKDVDITLDQLRDDASHPSLVRTWAAAARVNRVDDMEELIAQASHVYSFPALDRPIALQVERLSGGAEVEALLELSAVQSELAPALAKPILAAGPDRLTKAVYTGKTQNVRFQAAAYLGALANQGRKDEVAASVTEALQYQSGGLPWSGGALYIPNLGWDQPLARELVRELIAWQIHCDVNGLADEVRQVQNNLQSIGLIYQVGFPSGWVDVHNTPALFEAWGTLMGGESARKILAEQDLLGHPTYGPLLKKMNK